MKLATRLALVLGLATGLGATLPATATAITSDADVYSQLELAATPLDSTALLAPTGSASLAQAGFDWAGPARRMTLADVPTPAPGAGQAAATPTAEPAAVPEPEGWALLLVGFGALFALPRRDSAGFSVRDLGR